MCDLQEPPVNTHTNRNVGKHVMDDVAEPIQGAERCRQDGGARQLVPLRPCLAPMPQWGGQSTAAWRPIGQLPPAAPLISPRGRATVSRQPRGEHGQMTVPPQPRTNTTDP